MTGTAPFNLYMSGDNVMGPAKLINNQPKCFNRYLKSNKISINADKTKYMLFSDNKNIKLPTIKIGNNKNSETSVTKFVCIHLDNIILYV